VRDANVVFVALDTIEADGKKLTRWTGGGAPPF
jgi:hypothetical protein